MAGNVFRLSPDDGSLIETFRVDGQPRGIGADGNVLFVGMLDSRLYAYRMPSGG